MPYRDTKPPAASLYSPTAQVRAFDPNFPAGHGAAAHTWTRSAPRLKLKGLPDCAAVQLPGRVPRVRPPPQLRVSTLPLRPTQPLVRRLRNFAPCSPLRLQAGQLRRAATSDPDPAELSVTKTATAPDVANAM